MDNALYFPFISVPESPWFTRTLLYWDRVGSIIPFEFTGTPERLTRYTRELLTEELLLQVHPGQYVWQAPRFSEAFVEFVESRPQQDLEDRRRRLRGSGTSRVHTEKMQDIADYLVQAKLAQKVDWSWCDVENKTAQEFMGYLASVLGKMEELNCTPVTDNAANLDPILVASQPVVAADRRLAPLRKVVLEHLLPAPKHPVSPTKLRFFKENHGALLRSFRQSIEQELASIADMADPDLQRYRLDNFLAQKADIIEEIVAHLSDSGFGNIVFSKVCAIIAAIPGVNAIFGLANAVYSAFAGNSRANLNGPLLYAAYAKKELM